MKRREFLKHFGMTGAAAVTLGLFSSRVFADTNLTPLQFGVPNTGLEGAKGHVVVVGGGMAGATAAKYLRLWGGTAVKVTLIDKNNKYVSNIMSNTVLNGQNSLNDLTYSWNKLISGYGVNFIQGAVASIDGANKSVSVSGYGSVNYDRLIVAPGIEFDLMPGMTSLSQYENDIPHAWQAGPQTELLRDQLQSIPNGGTVVITIPKAPYRCPPGPYERTCVIADWVSRYRTGCKVIVLDANADVLVEKDNFHNAFDVLYAGIVSYRPNSTVEQIDVINKTITYSDLIDSHVTVAANVLNPIPPQKAPQLLVDAGLVVSPDRFAPINVLSYESTKVPYIHVIGDASLTTMPKAGHIGNQEGKTCADAVINLLNGRTVDSSPVLNSACYTPITATTATWLSAVYQYDSTNKKMIIPAQHNIGQAIAASAPSTENYEEMIDWFKILMGDTFV